MTTRPTMGHRAAATTASLLALGAGAAAIAAAGRTLPFPDGVAPDRLVLWTAEVGPVTAGFTAARALAALLVGWLALTGLASILVRLLHLTVVIRATDALTLPSVRRLADLVAGAAVVAVSLTPATVAGAVTAPTPVVVMQDLGPTTGGAATTTTTPAPTAPPPSTTTSTSSTTPPVVTMVQPPQAASGAARGGGSTPPTGATVAPTARPAPIRDEATWVIAPGDTLWNLADTTATDHLGRAASGREVLEQLDRLLALNADRLAVPGDADLVFPGQEFLIPPGP